MKFALAIISAVVVTANGFVVGPALVTKQCPTPSSWGHPFSSSSRDQQQVRNMMRRPTLQHDEHLPQEHKDQAPFLVSLWERSTNTMAAAGFEEPYIESRGIAARSMIVFGIFALSVKWYRARYITKIPIWDRQPQWNMVITSPEQEKNLKAIRCKNCGSTIFVAKNRDSMFRGNRGLAGLGCFTCGEKGADNFEDVRQEILESLPEDDYFDYERPLDFVSRNERRKLLKLTGGDEAAANEILVQRAADEAAAEEDEEEEGLVGGDKSTPKAAEEEKSEEEKTVDLLDGEKAAEEPVAETTTEPEMPIKVAKPEKAAKEESAAPGSALEKEQEEKVKPKETVAKKPASKKAKKPASKKAKNPPKKEKTTEKKAESDSDLDLDDLADILGLDD